MDDESDLNTLTPEGGGATGISVVGDRFHLLDIVGQGGDGTVYRAHDARLQARVAVKLRQTDDPSGERKRQRETPIEGRFRHPYLVRLIDRGIHGDDVSWHAMEWVEGGTFVDVLDELHQSKACHEPTLQPPGSTITTGDPNLSWVALRPAIFLLSHAALGLGAAHRQGLVHLDLKPDNVMFELRRWEESLVNPVEYRAWLDDDADDRATQSHLVPVPRLIDWGLGRGIEGETRTETGPVPGAPHYMAPERACGRRALPTADVYALGAILYHLLVGERPFGSATRSDVLGMLQGPQPTAPRLARIDPDLREFASVCRRAMDFDASARHEDGLAFGQALQRAQALRTLRRAQYKRQRARELHAHAAGLQSRADAISRTSGRERVEDRYPAWELEDKAAEDQHEANKREAQWLRSVRAVLAVDPDLAEGRAALVEWRCEQLQLAEQENNARDALLTLEALKVDARHLGDLRGPVSADVTATREKARTLIDGESRLTVRTHDDVTIKIARVVSNRRRLIMGGDYRTIGRGGVSGERLEFGRALLRFEAPGHHSALLPLRVHRGEHLKLTAPGDGAPTRIVLPPDGELSDEDVFIAPGWAWLGGQRYACDGIQPGRRAWLDGFIMKKNPVTHAEWLIYLNDLVRRGRDDEAEARVPGVADIPRPWVPRYRRDGKTFRLCGTVERINDMLRWPVGSISWHDALSFADWRAVRENKPWRLPCEWEFEKAARCNDERRLPWGDHLEPTWTRVGGSTDAMYGPAPVDDTTMDVTIHGLRWLAGNMMTWCLDPWSFDGPLANTRVEIPRSREATDYRMLRGGAPFTPEHFISGSSRFATAPADRGTPGGVRLVRSWPA